MILFTWLKRYADFAGRSSRKEYWMGILGYFIILIGAGIVDSILGGIVGYGFGLIYGLTILAVIVPGLAMSVRRLHDIDMTGWLVLLGMIPLIGLILLYWYVQPGQPRENKFGAPPPETPGLVQEQAAAFT